MRLVFGFIWGGRYEYVARIRMLVGIEVGGRDVLYFSLKLDCIFVFFLCRELFVIIVYFLGYFLRFYFVY